MSGCPCLQMEQVEHLRIGPGPPTANIGMGLFGIPWDGHLEPQHSVKQKPDFSEDFRENPSVNPFVDQFWRSHDTNSPHPRGDPQPANCA